MNHHENRTTIVAMSEGAVDFIRAAGRDRLNTTTAKVVATPTAGDVIDAVVTAMLPVDIPLMRLASRLFLLVVPWTTGQLRATSMTAAELRAAGARLEHRVVARRRDGRYEFASSYGDDD